MPLATLDGVLLNGPWRACVADDDLRRSALAPEFDDSSWAEITVPSHWRSHPQFADNDASLLYRTPVAIAAAQPGRRQFVVCDGIFYQADLWFDGAYLGDHEGYFSPAAFEITDLAPLGDQHVLAVEVSSQRQRADAPKRAITGAFHNPEMIDPAWNPGGLWRPVRVEETGAVRIDRLRVLCRDVNDARAHLRLHARLDCDDARQVRLRTLVDGVPAHEHEQSLARGVNEVDWNIDIDEPDLWWPWSLGEQPLTEVAIEVLVDGDCSHRSALLTGLREVTLTDWVFSVNGERLFAKGACLAPTRRDLGAATPQEIADDVALARDTGLDLLRVHTHIARPELYDAADRLGMLLWQDFPLQHSYARGIRKEAVRQARDAVDLLGHHPSIAAWCAHNEPMGPLAASQEASTKRFIGSLARAQAPSWNRTILDRWVKRAFESADETRVTLTHSGVMPHLPRLEGTDSHLFFGWRQGRTGDLARFAARMPRMVRFVSEFGAQAVPQTAGFMVPERWPALAWDDLVEHHGMDAEAFARAAPTDHHDSFDGWRDATQAHQAQVVRATIETLRTLKYRPTGGFCLFMLNDAEPRVSASVVDHQRHPKPAYQALVDACRPVIVVAEQFADVLRSGATVGIDVYAVSDLRQRLERTKCTATLTWPGGSHTWQWEGDIEADSCGRVGTVRFVVADAPGRLCLDLTLEHGEQVATNRYESTIIR
jgi:beta-mannosidase